MEPRLLRTLPYFGDGLLPSVAQPPLPLQEFLPLQPLSPVLQPPLPLQEFLPAHSCFSTAPPFFSAMRPGFAELLLVVGVAACMDPVRSPARAAPASRV